MSYQQVFATISDNMGQAGQTRSCRGRVDEADAWFNTDIGEAGNVRVSVDQRTAFDYNRLSECKNKIAQYTKTGNKKKEDYWVMQLRNAEELETKEKARRITMNIELKQPDKTDITITCKGCTITNEDIQQIIQHKKIVEAL